MVALAELSLLRAGDDRHEESLALAREARARVDADCAAAYATAGIALAASARAELRAGNADRARRDLAAAARTVPLLTHAIPWLSAQALLELARAHAALLELDEARALLTRARGILRRRPGLGRLPAAAAALGRELNALGSGPAAADSTLTPAELRLVPLLATHMSFREIGEHLHVSRNTVKTQAIAVYRKLGVSSRSDAIERAAGLGLVRPALPVAAASSPRDDAWASPTG
jgi:LuxR family maltose regulon positive regulatory protein